MKTPRNSLLVWLVHCQHGIYAHVQGGNFIYRWTRKMETITKRQVDGNVAFIPVFFFLFLWTVFWQKQDIAGIKIMQQRTKKKVLINDLLHSSMCWLVIFVVRAGLHVQHTNSGLLQSLPHQRCHRWCEDLGPANAKVLLSSFSVGTIILLFVGAAGQHRIMK